MQRRQRQQSHARVLRRLSFRNFVLLILVLTALAMSPSLYFYTKSYLFEHEGKVQGCEWLRNPPMVCAHGGDSSRMPPNTLAAYKAAMEERVNCIEIDASRSSDGVLFALHDRDLQTITGRNSVRVGDFSATEIKQLETSTRLMNEKLNVLTLEDALRYVSRSLKQVIIDAKVGPPLFEESLASDIVSLVRRVSCKNCIVWAKADSLVRNLVELSREIPMGYIVMNDTATGKVTELLRIKDAPVVGIHHGLVDANVVSYLHRPGKKVYAWTVEKSTAMLDMLKAGVDAIITSHPQLLQQVMQDHRQQCILQGYSAF